MSHIFLSYMFTGEDPKELSYQLGGIEESLRFAGHEVICSFNFEHQFREKKFNADQIYQFMLNRQEEAGIFMALVKTADRSQGMLLELEKARELSQRYVLLTRGGINIPDFNDAAKEIILFDDFDSLFSRLRSFN